MRFSEQEAVEQLEVAANNPRNDTSGYKVEEYSPLTIIGLMRNSEAESKAVRLNFNEQRLLHKYYNKIDADCSYVLRLSHLDYAMAVKQQDRLRTRSSNVKTNLKPEEHAHFQEQDSKGLFKMPNDSRVRSMNYNSAKIIQEAHLRLFRRATGELPPYLKKFKAERTAMSLKNKHSESKVTFKNNGMNIDNIESEVNSEVSSESDSSEKRLPRRPVRAVQSAVHCGTDTPSSGRPLTTWTTYNNKVKPGFVPYTGNQSAVWTPRRTTNASRTSRYSSALYGKQQTNNMELCDLKQLWLSNEHQKMDNLTNGSVKTFLHSISQLKVDKYPVIA